jgi:mRNA-degrading endonuclease RelE of RelBE toxin-antitoxin system
VPQKKDPLIRETIVGSYRVIYRIDEASRVVALARIWHSARGTPEL